MPTLYFGIANKKRKKEKSTTLKFQPFHHGCCSSNTGRRSRLWSWKKGQIRAFPCRHKDERHYLQPPGTSVTDSSAQRPSSSTHTSWHPHRTMMRLRASGSELSRYLQLGMRMVRIFFDCIRDRIRLEGFKSVHFRVQIFNIRYRIRIRILKSHIYDVDIQSYRIRHGWHYPYSNSNPDRNMKTNVISSVSDPF